MKKILTVLLASCALVSTTQAESTAASAQAPMASTSTSPFNGFYAGLGVGYGRTHAEANLSGGPFNNLKIPSSNADSAIVDIYAGYGWVYDCWYWGGELLLEHNQASLKKNQISSTGLVDALNRDMSPYKRDPFVFGVAARIGYLVSPNSMAYVRIGGESVKYKVAGDREAFFTDTAQTVLVFSPGVGFEYLASKKVSIRAEYIYTMRRNIVFNYNATGQALIAGLAHAGTTGTKISPSQHAFKLGVIYHF
jgi:opacity protein-like surface antigen